MNISASRITKLIILLNVSFCAVFLLYSMLFSGTSSKIITSDFLTKSEFKSEFISQLKPTVDALAAHPEVTELTLLEASKAYQRHYCAEVHPVHMTASVSNHVIQLTGDANPSQVNMALYDSNDIVSNQILFAGGWQMSEFSILLAQMEKAKDEGISDPLILDIGSNIGWFSVNIAAHGFNVITFDAMRENGFLYRTTLCNNPILMEKVTFVNKGLSDVEYTNCNVVSHDINVGDGHITCDNLDKGTEYVYRNHADLVRLDSYVKQDVYLLVIDVEGFEMHVLRGATKLLAKHTINYFYSEFSPEMMNEKGSVGVDYIRFWLSNGYEISLSGFDGPYLEFIQGDEMQTFDPLYSPGFIINIYGRKKRE